MDKTTLKSWFSKGKKPLASQFAAWIDSFWHKDEKIPIESISGLSNLLVNVYEKDEVNDLLTRKASLEHKHLKSEITDFTHKHELSDITGIETIISRGYTLDFGTTLELVQDANVMGNITINRIVSRNVTALYVTYGNVARQEVNPNGEVQLNIPDGAILNWEIVRGADDSLACVGIRYNINVNQEG